MAVKYCDQRVCISGHTHISKTTCSNCTNFLCINLGCAFSALTLLVGRQKGHPACKKTEWWGAGMVIWLERGADLHCIWPSWCHCHSLSLALLKSRLVLPFWYRLTWVVPDKGPLNGCVCVTLAVDRSFWWQRYKLCTRTSSFVDDDMTSCSQTMAIMTTRIGHMLRLIQQGAALISYGWRPSLILWITLSNNNKLNCSLLSFYLGKNISNSVHTYTRLTALFGIQG